MTNHANYDVGEELEPSPPAGRRADGAESVRVLRPRRAAPSEALRPTRAEINLEALRHNLHVMARHAGPAKVWPVLKADGYGHGAPAVARTLERAGATGFCVALLEEAVELREAGIRAPILVMGGYYGGAFDEIVARAVTPVVYDGSHLEGLARAARQAGRPIDAHLKIDTGMARLGVRPAELAAFTAELARFPEVRVAGLMTHLACAEATGDERRGYTAEQVARFEEATSQLARAGIAPAVRHAANSAAVLREEALFDLVRPGVAVFGVSPLACRDPDLRPAMRVRSEVVDLRTVRAGETVGYGALFRASREARIATVPMGYADGLSRHLSEGGHVLVRGARAPIVGAVSMDMSMIDVTDLPGVALRDEVTILGAQEGPLGKALVAAEEIARHAGTIPWEVLTAVSRRVPRFYREP